ncbi:MAG: hypothetical protein LQ346_005426 [Caloplaca aetnensis]|nr:MAG: hypothetical protein LQ346_005426 [Caloplaca aetnensis]
MGAPPAPKRDVVWVDGLRGIASVLVVTAHICRSLVPHLLSPAMSDKLPPTLFQLPFLRCLVMGRASVAIFALVTGYVNSLGPLKKSRAGNADVALAGIAKSAFRRFGRFMIPAMVATILSWLACQFGAYNVAHVANSAWIRDTSPTASASFAGAFYDLFKNLGTTWIDGMNQYDRIQWTLTYLLKGSMMTYLSLFALIYVKPRWRMALIAGMFYFKWKSGDCKQHPRMMIPKTDIQQALVGFNVYCGIFLAEASIDADIAAFVAAHPILQSVGSASMIILGLYFCSYPEEHPEWAPWSNSMLHMGQWIFPAGVEYSRYYPGMGADIVATGVMFNTTAKKILSHRFLCWMGKLSWPVYLLHAPLIRTVLTWVLFGASVRPQQGKDTNGNQLPPGWLPIANTWVVVFALPLFYVFLYRVAGLWASYVDPWCTNVTQRFEELVFRDDAKSEKPILLS